MRKMRQWLLVTMYLMAVLLVVGTSAMAATVSGTVVGDGNPFSNGSTFVVVYGPASNACSAQFFTYGAVNSNGTFSVSGMPPSTSKYFLKTWSTMPYADRWFTHNGSTYTYGSYDCSEAHGITFSAANSVETNAVVYLEKGQNVTGTVTGSGSGDTTVAGNTITENGVKIPDLQKNSYVLALIQKTVNGALTDGCSSPIYSISTLSPPTENTPSSTGTFDTDILPPNNNYYFMTYSPTKFLSEWYRGTISSTTRCQDAVPLSITTSGTSISGVNFQLSNDVGGTITGKVEFTTGTTTTTTGVKRILINVYKYQDYYYDDGTTQTLSPCHQGPWVTTAFVQEDGTYTTPKLLNGDYLLQSFDPNGLYVNEWYEDNGDNYLCSKADKLSVNGSMLEHRDFTLDPIQYKSIKGTVKDSSNGNLANIKVVAYEYLDLPSGMCRAGKMVDYVTTLSDGSYTISDLPNGNYLVQAIDEANGKYQSEWYAGNSSVAECKDAKAVLVKDDVLSIDFQLDNNSKYTISGSVSSPNGAINYSTVDLYINVYEYDSTDCSNGKWVTSAVVNETGTTAGTYTTAPLEPGKYILQSYSVPQGTTPTSYVNEWYSTAGNAYFCTSASPVTVPSSTGAVKNINFSLDKQ